MKKDSIHIIQSSSDPIILFVGTKVLEGSRAALDFFGFEDRFSFLNARLENFFPAEQANGVPSLQKFHQIIRQAHDEGVGKDTFLCKNQQEELFVAEVIVLALQQEQEGEVVYQCKWRLSEKEKNGHRSPLSLTFSIPSQPVGEIKVNQKGEIVFADSVAASCLGYSIQELMEISSLADLLVYSENGLGEPAKAEHWIKRLQEEKGARQEVSLVFLTKERKQVLFQVNLQEEEGKEKWENYCRLLLRPVNLHGLAQNYPSATLSAIELESLRKENKNLKRSQKALKKSLERFRLLANYSPDVIMQFDRAYRHLVVNSQVEGQIGFKEEEFIGKTHAEMGFPPEFARQCKEALRKVFDSGESHRLDLQLPTGRWVDWYLIPEFGEQGKVNTVITTARDITDQKKTQLQLQKSERKLQDAFKVTRLSAWEYDFLSDQVILNPEFNGLLGFPESQKKGLSGREFVEQFVVRDDLGKFRFVIDAALESCSEDFQEVIDYRIRRTDGEIVHILASVRLEIGEDGRIAKAYGTSQDITYLRLTEQELEEYRTSLERLVDTRTQELKRSEAKLADALRLANLGTWEFDPSLQCFIVSDEVLEIIGSTAEIEEGNVISIDRCKEIILPDDYEHYRQVVNRATQSADDSFTEQTELRIVRSDGDIRHIYLSIKINKQPFSLRFFGTVQDITEIRRTETKKNQLDAIIETTSDIVGIAHVDGSISYLNKAGKSFFGIKEEEEMLHKTFSHFQSPKHARRLTKKELEHAAIHGTWDGQNQYIRWDGTEVPVSQVIIAHKNNEGEVESYSTIIRDISQQKKIEQDLIFKNNELDTFVYRASHDLRGPIATLMGLYNLVQYEQFSEKACSLFDMYNSQVLRLNTITLTLIELTKIKESEFRPSEVNLGELVSSIFSKMQGMTESRNMFFQRDIEDIRGFVSDERLLAVIFQNLVENSIKYKRQDVDPFVKVEIRKKEESDRIIIKVSDNGIGIDSNIQPKIFNMFFRGNERSSGSGLGLYILKNAVEKLGGRVTLYSVMYKGTTFKIELPPISPEPAGE
ncbi:PAS domain S-box protein [Nafulsella turpanensis]|uniref:PAS domain S-box protein n=1 Tax=Nafulsella turpanensis TaxID=1265690 RepID=UPI00034C95C0|nr:PAS domain S-box protein [Nafulsella turpanensis]